MAQNRFYSSTAQKTTLNGGISNSATTIIVLATTGFPVSFPYTLILERDTVNEEVVKVTGAAGTTLTVVRGQDGTSGVAHSTGTTVEHGVSAQDFTEPQAHIGASAAVHGLAGTVVGTSDAQTLTSKTINLASNTLTGTTAQFNTALSDNDFATLAGSETLTNKTLTAPTLTNATVSGGFTATNPSTAATVLTTVTGSSNGVIVQPGAASAIGLFVQGLASQSGPLVRLKQSTTPTGPFIECFDSLSNSLFSVASDGTVAMTASAASTIGGVSGTSLAADRTAWTTYTPTFTNVTSPTGAFAYKVIGKTLHIRGLFTGGTVTSTTTIGVSLPAGLTTVAAFQVLYGSNATGAFGWTINGSTGTIQSGNSLSNGIGLNGYSFTGVLEVT